MEQIVRVATSNNFNCTPAEWAQLHAFELKNPDKHFFINANIKTPKLHTINHHNNKVVITLNPDLVIRPSLVAKLQTLNPARIAFVRIKYIPNHPEILNLIKASAKTHNVVITIQRFNSINSLRLQGCNPDHYHWSCSRYRLQGPELKKIQTTVDELNQSGAPVWICDRKGQGCQGCGLCSKLTSGRNLPVTSLNLSSSGICPYSCPDCYAKRMQEFSKAMGNSAIRFDNISKNDKQAGRTKHIKELTRREAVSI